MLVYKSWWCDRVKIYAAVCLSRFLPVNPFPVFNHLLCLFFFFRYLYGVGAVLLTVHQHVVYK